MGHEGPVQLDVTLNTTGACAHTQHREGWANAHFMPSHSLASFTRATHQPLIQTDCISMNH